MLKNKLEALLTSRNVVQFFYSELKNKDFRDELFEVLPELEHCANQQQRTVHHVYDVLGHTLKSIENIVLNESIGKEDKLKYAYVMLLHDIGKPRSHAVREKNGALVDTFYGHPGISTDIAKRFLKDMNFSEKEIDEMTFLISRHESLINFSVKENMPGKTPVNLETVEKFMLTRLNAKDVKEAHENWRKLEPVMLADIYAQNPDPQIMQPKLDVLTEFNKCEEAIYKEHVQGSFVAKK